MDYTEALWRHLLGEACRGKRHWPTLTHLASDLDVSLSTAYRCLQRPTEIGAVENSRLGGVEVLDPARLLMLYGARRRLQRHIHATITTKLTAAQCEHELHNDGYTLGGFAALIHHTGARNRIADYTTVIAYGPAPKPGPPADDSEPATTILIVPRDKWMQPTANYTTAGHAWADLFSLPGWQAARFISETDIHAITEPAEPLLLI